MTNSKAVLKVFLFTDLVGSTDLKHRLGDAEAAAIIARHDALFRECLNKFGGSEEVNPGDEFFATFDLPSDAVRCALAFLKELSTLNVSDTLRVRIGVHMGETIQVATSEAERHKLLGLAVDTAARVMSLGQPGQILLTRHAFDSVRQHVGRAPDGSAVECLAHGRYLFKGVSDPLEVFEIGVPSDAPLSPPPSSEKAKRILAPGDEETLGWRPAVGLTVPGRTGWTLERNLGAGGFGEVWLARHHKTRDVRAFKFCYEADRLRALKRELTLFRLMKETLGERRDIAKLYEVRLDKPPFYLEMEYTNGGDLAEWSEGQGGIGKVPTATRIKLITEVADALAAAHSAGIIHKDINPSNILIHVPKGGEPEARLTDFGIGQLVSTVSLKEAGITITGFGSPATMQREMSAYTGTRLYMAPEVVAGASPSIQSDIYSLGVLLYQAVVGDLDDSLPHDWESNIADELMRADITACVREEAQDRLASASELASRLRSLDQRRQELVGEGEQIGAEPRKGPGVKLVLGSESLPADAIPGYEILKELHRGGQGVVYQAVQLATKRKVALKVMLEGPFAGRDSKRRFEREIALVGSLRHPNIVPVFDSGIAQGRFYYAMEYIRGQSLLDYVRTKNFSVDETMRIFQKVCDAVDYAHQKGVIHRDLKPSNILVDQRGQPHVLDFGLAKIGGPEAEGDAASLLISVTGQVMGTLGYMSPEQAAGRHDEVDMRSDVYALGVILFELLTGKTPYDLTGQMAEVLTRIQQTEPFRPSSIRRQINDEVETIVLKALSKEKQRRYAMAGMLGQDIGHFLAGEPIDAKRDSGWYVLKKSVHRYKLPIAVALAIAASLGTGTVVSAWFAIQATRARALAENRREQAEAHQAEAQRQAAIVEAINHFLGNMFSSVDPETVAGRKVTVEEVLSHAAATINAGFRERPEIEAAVRMTTGTIFKSIGLYDRANLHLRAAEAIQVRVLGVESQETLRTRTTIGALLMLEGNYRGAEELVRDTLDVKRRVLGDEHPDTLASTNNLANLSLRRGEIDEAQRLHRRTLEARRRVLGDEHPETLASMNNLASVLKRQGKYGEAASLHRQTLDIQRRVLGDAHPDTLGSMNNLAIALKRLGKPAEAEQLLQEGLRIQSRALGEEHPRTLNFMHNLSLVLRDLGKYSEAESLHRKTYQTDRRVFGDTHPETIRVLKTLVKLYRVQGKSDEQRAAMSDLIGLYKQRAEQEPPNADALNEYAWELLTCAPEELRDPETAVSVAQQAAEATDNMDPAILDTLALAYQMTGQIDLAIATQRKAVFLLPKEASAERNGYEQRLNALLEEKATK